MAKLPRSTGSSSQAPAPRPAADSRAGGRRRLLVWSAAIIALAAAGGAAAWWFAATRPLRSATGLELGRLVGGVERSDLNLLLITLDTTRADRIGAYGYEPIETPTIDRLASEGVLFEQAMASAPLTLPAHSTIFTSQYPPVHGVRDNGGFFLAPSQLTLAEILKAHGFQTGAAVGAYVLDGKWGLNQGFDTYLDDFNFAGIGGFGLGDIKRPGNEVVDKALPWLERVKGQRFFAWLHFYDPHFPYTSPEPFKSRYEDHPYNGAIAFTDAQVARVIGFLEQNGLLDRTIVVVMGDHGEGLDQHGEGTHGFFIYESTTRVPFVIRAPFDLMRHRRVADPVRSVDVLPTVLDLLGVPAPAGIAGVSLASLMTGARKTLDLEGYAEALYPLHHYGWSELRAWRAGRFKVIDAPRPELYDLDQDPGETVNLYAERRSVADTMIARLRTQERDAAASGAARQGTPEIDPEARARLAALGYVGSFVATVSAPTTARADPKDKIELFNLLTDSSEIAKEDGSFERVVAMLNRVVKEDPNVIDAWFKLGNSYYKVRKYEEAIKYFQQALVLKPDYDLAVINMANAYRRLGRDDAALAGYEHYLTIDPRNAHVRYQVGEIYLDRGDAARAETNFKQALEIDKREASAMNALGVIAFQRGDLVTAERLVRAAIEIKDDVRLAHYNLALVAEARGDDRTAEAEYRRELELHAAAYKAAYNLSVLCAKKGDTTAQVAALKQAVAANPAFAEGSISLAKAYLDAGINLSEALSLARKGVELAPDSPLAPLGHFVMADVLLRQGQSEAAARALAAGKASEARQQTRRN